MEQEKEVIAVRSLADSDLGIFAAHRASTTSRQRAININAPVAARLLSTEAVNGNGLLLDCCIIFGELHFFSKRHLGKVGKNWRLGGNKIKGNEFAHLDSKDFAIIRSIEKNSGDSPIIILFISKAKEQLKHARIVRLVEPTIQDSMAIYLEGSAGFKQLANLFPKAAKREIAGKSNPQKKSSVQLPLIQLSSLDEMRIRKSEIRPS